MKLLNLLFLCCIALTINAQQTDSLKNKERKNKISLEIGGGHLLIGLDYERLLVKNKSHALFSSIGVGTTQFFIKDIDTRISMPININYHFGAKKSKLYIGLGIINLFALYPYPQNDSLRKEVAKSPYTHTEGSMYVPRYQLYINQNIGYAFESKKIVLRFFLTNYLYKTIYKPTLIQTKQFVGIQVGLKF